jgi:hypothetical protein
MSDIVKSNNALSDYQIADIEARVSRVRSLLKQSTAAWLSIAKEFAIAKKDLKQHAFEAFVNRVGLTKSVSDKLLKIGACNPLFEEQNLEFISSVEGWTVLYELAKLEVKQIYELIEKLRGESKLKLTREVIFNFAKKQPLGDKRLICISVEIDESRLNTISNDKFKDMLSSINDLQQQIDRINAGFVVKKRGKSLDLVERRAAANSSAFVVETIAA